jgi:hypothetical protein
MLRFTVIPEGMIIISPHPGTNPQLQFVGFDQFPFAKAVQTAALACKFTIDIKINESV